MQAENACFSRDNRIIDIKIRDFRIQMVAAELRHWAQSFRDEEQNVRDTVRKIRQNPLIPKDVPVHGLIFHPRRGKADVLVNGYGEIRNRMDFLHCMEMREVKELN